MWGKLFILTELRVFSQSQTRHRSGATAHTRSSQIERWRERGGGGGRKMERERGSLEGVRYTDMKRGCWRWGPDGLIQCVGLAERGGWLQY